MSVVSDSVLKSYFTIGSVVDESDMIDLIDSKKNGIDDEECVSVFMNDVVVGTSVPIFRASRNITLTYYAIAKQSTLPTITHQFKKNSAGTLSNMTATSTSYNQTDVASSFPTVTLTSTDMEAGDVIYSDISVISGASGVGSLVTFSIRYIDRD